MPIHIRKATEEDFPAILGLIKELAEFQKMPEKVANSVTQMKREKDFFQSFVAVTADGEIVGMALFFFAYFTWAGKSLYLDDLYVKAACRGQKIGSRLLNAIFETARVMDCHRVRWQVSAWNEAAIALYEKCGAEIDTGVYNCDVNGQRVLAFRL